MKIHRMQPDTPSWGLRWLLLSGTAGALLTACSEGVSDPPYTGVGGQGGSGTGDLSTINSTVTSSTTSTTGFGTSGGFGGSGGQSVVSTSANDSTSSSSSGVTTFGPSSSQTSTTDGGTTGAGTTGAGTTDGTTDGGTTSGGAGGASSTTATTGSSTTGPLPRFVGNIDTRRNVDTNDRTFSTYWDQITPENAGKWGSVQQNPSSAFNWATLDAIYDYSQQNGIIFKQHTFVWGSQQPSGSINETHVKTWMQEFCTRYPETRIIDVVNEPPPHTTPSYTDAIGGGTNGNWQWITNAFIWAREACPNAILILNDYNNIEWADQNQHFINIVKTIQAAGAPIDGVGAQAHGLSSGVSTQTMKSLITKLHNDTGLPVYITEYDIDLNDDNAQLQKYQEHIPFFLETEWIKGVTIWGWIHGSTWVPNSGLIRNGTPRPALTWLMEQLGRPAP